MKRKALFLPLIIFSLFSCNDVSDFLFDTSRSVEIESINDGALVAGDSAIPLNVFSRGSTVPDSCTITIFDESGVNWGETTIDIPSFSDQFTSSIIVPDKLPAGKYIFHISIYENSVEISSREVTVFKVNGTYAIDQLVSLPHETKPGKDVFIHADISCPEGSDPYLRWSLNGSVLKEGYLSDGLDDLHWIAEEETGIYTVFLELFPEKCSSDLVSSVKNSADIVVSESSLGEEGALQPEESYSLLYHFNGSLFPVNPENFVTGLTGSAGAQPVEDSFYYTLSGNAGISASGNILPSRDGVLTPFSINARISAIDPIEAGSLFRVYDGKDLPLSLSLDESGHLVLNIKGEISRSRFVLTEMTDITIHVIPGNDGTEIRWFSNGKPDGSDILETGKLSLSGELQDAVLGGDKEENSCGLILDEFGIYVGSGEYSTVDAEQFSRIEKSRLGENLMAADGFDGIESGLSVTPGEMSPIGGFTGSQKQTEAVFAFSSISPEDIGAIILKNNATGETVRFAIKDFISDENSRSSEIAGTIRFSLGGPEENKVVEKSGFSYTPGTNYSLFLESDVENNNDIVLDYYIVYSITDSLLSEPVVSIVKEKDLL